MERFKTWLDSLKFDFVSYRWYWFAGTFTLVVLSWVAFFAIGPNWGIDFTGGTEVRMQFDEPIEADDLRKAVSVLGVGADAVQQVGSASNNEFSIRVQDPEFGMKELEEQVRKQLAAHFGADWIQKVTANTEVGARLTVTHAGGLVQTDEVKAALAGIEGVGVQPGRDVDQVIVIVPGLQKIVQAEIGKRLTDRTFQIRSVDAVGPKVGADLRKAAFISIFAAIGLIMLYTALRFDFAYSPGVVVSLFHDMSIPIGVFTVLGLQFDLGLIGALLTILGFSMNDTVIIYGRIRENREKYKRMPLLEVINQSLNEVLTRTVTTSFTAIISILMFVFMGGPVLFSFAFAILVGFSFGTYSSIYIAAPMVVLLEDFRPTLERWVGGRAAGAADTAIAENELSPASPPIGRPAPPPPVVGPVVAPRAEGQPTAALTESEKRRRERAEAERKHSGEG
jgi:preprotein translocase subunit SecF